MKGKAVSGLMLTLLLIGILPLVFDIQPVESSSIIVVPDDYFMIQYAVGNASDGDTILVREGPYYEHVVVNKRVSLVGDDDGDRTVIIGDKTGCTIYVTADNVTISGFKVYNYVGDYGIILDHSSNSVVDRNIVKAEWGFRVDGGSGNNISNNRMEESPTETYVWHSIDMIDSTDNVVIGNFLGGYTQDVALSMYNSHRNYFAFNYLFGTSIWGITVRLTKADNNSFVGNLIGGGIGTLYFSESKGNLLYHNNFLPPGGPNWIVIDELSINNTWDNGYPSGGNYWSNYNGIDSYQGPYQNETGSDGIGDAPFTIVANHTDYYPLMTRWAPPSPYSYTLTILSSPTGVTFTVDYYYVHSTPWSETYYRGDSAYLGMPETCNVGGTEYFWIKWSDEVTSRWRDVTLNTNITLTAYYGRRYQLTITSLPITGVPFTIDETPQTTPYTEELLEGSHTLEMPQSGDVYSWSHWLEDDDANRTKTFTLDGNTTLTAVYIPPPAVGGIYIPTNTLELLAPYIGLSLLLAVAAATVVYAKKRKKQ